jgi:hypothetical protein
VTDTTPADDLIKRIADYVTGGGLWNPELANHMAVRDLLLECRDALRARAASQPAQEPVRLPDFIRREVERAIDDAINPNGMSVHDGKATIGADKLQYMLRVIDAAPLSGKPEPAQEPDAWIDPKSIEWLRENPEHRVLMAQLRGIPIPGWIPLYAAPLSDKAKQDRIMELADQFAVAHALAMRKWPHDEKDLETAKVARAALEAEVRKP